MVPCLHQSNVNIKRKLRVWRVQKGIPLDSAKTLLTCVGLQTTLSQVTLYRAENRNFRISESTIFHGTVFAPKQCLYQKKATASRVSQYRAENGNLKKSGSTFRQGTVFAPKQFLHQQEATGMVSPKMHSSIWCKNRSYLCVTANYPVSCKPLEGRERKFEDIRVYLSPWYRICLKAMFIAKGTYRYGESKIAFL